MTRHPSLPRIHSPEVASRRRRSRRAWCCMRRPATRHRGVPLPTLLEVDADSGVIQLRGTGSHCHDGAAPRQAIDGTERLGELNGAAHHGERHRGRQRHSAGMGEHSGQRGGAVQPGHREDHVVVRRQRGEAQTVRSLRIPDEVVECVRMAAEVHQGQVGAKLHVSTLSRSRSELSGLRCGRAVRRLWSAFPPVAMVGAPPRRATPLSASARCLNWWTESCATKLVQGRCPRSCPSIAKRGLQCPAAAILHR